jgi:type II secretory pathway pseudopilin PulG
MTPRPGWTLIEITVVVGILAALITMTVPLMHALSVDLTFAQQAVATDAAVRRMLGRLQEDLDAATSLPQAAGGVSAGAERILLATPRGVVAYEIGPDTVTRTVLPPSVTSSRPSGPEATTEPAEPAERSVWHTPHAQIDWAPHQRGGRTVGIEIRSAVVWRSGGSAERKLANARVLFLPPPGQGRSKT